MEFSLTAVDVVPESLKKVSRPRSTKSLQIVNQLVAIPSHCAKISIEELGTIPRKFRLNTANTRKIIDKVVPNGKVCKAFNASTNEFYFWIE